MPKTVSTALKAHLALPQQSMCTCWLARLNNGDVYGFTDHDEDITISGWSSPDNILHATYVADSGFTSKAIQTSDALNVDNTGGEGLLRSPSIDEDDLRAGLWDFARVYIFEVNWKDITMGPLYHRVGWLGEVTHGRLVWKSDFRGLMDLYRRNLLGLTSPMCRVKRFGDAMCGVEIGGSPSYISTHTVDDVAADNQTFYCAALTAPGPQDGVSIVSITNANPGIVVLADDSLSLSDGDVVNISGALGMLPVNGNIIVRNPSGNSFALDFDTTDTGDYPAYTGGGEVVPLGGASGYYDYGIVTWLTGANEGLSMEVKSYVPGQVTLALPMPFAISGAGDSPTDSFSITAGCNRSPDACKNKFHNFNRFRGEPWVRGFDRMIQVGRQTS